MTEKTYLQLPSHNSKISKQLQTQRDACMRSNRKERKEKKEKMGTDEEEKKISGEKSQWFPRVQRDP